MMFGLALRSLRHRTGAFAAAFCATFLGGTLVMAFASLLDTAVADGVPATSRETLITMASVVGGWGLIMVAFSVTSTLSLAVRQRTDEIALLKSAGATPAQIRRMIVGEAAALGLAGTLAAIVPALLGGRLLLDLLIDTGQVAPGVEYAFGPFALTIGAAVTFAGSTFAALLTARRTTRMRVTETLLEAGTRSGRTSRKRVVFALLFLLLGADLAIVTATVMRGEGSDAMQTAGQTSIWVAVGFALLGPMLLSASARLLAGPLAAAGAAGYLARHNLSGRTQQLAGALMPIILFTGIATGTIYMQRVDDAALAAEGLRASVEQDNIKTLNFVVVGMLVLFAAIMLINTLIATTMDRRGEFARQRLTGATPRQVLAVTGLEAAVLTVVGVVFGTIAALCTIVPFTYARTGDPLPDDTLAVYAGVVAVAALLALTTSLATTRRALRTPAVEAVAV
ncbi:ABC transporter permease [Actinomadura keratinilytica]